ncbi:MAG TPA: Caa(3)-type oxidase subunit IV [Xanthobacteraceae bacterium]|jgi:caa(3)-type oxidase subunit IV|nr:Caa(3)-type oxidase subunit IV [Xanthobacteraceae bacterium]
MTDPSNPQSGARERDARSEQAWWLWKGPALVWLALIVLFGISFGVAYLPLGGANLAAHLAIAAVMIVLLVTFLMDMRNATAIVRLIGGAGLFWLILMFSLTFNDYLSRHY